jgi:hypothetical protein
MLLDPTQNPNLFTEGYHTRICNWNRALDSYDATVDWPVAEFWEELAMECANAKVILTIRDPEAWDRSVAGTIQDWPVSFDLEWPQRMLRGRKMARTIIREGVLRQFHDKSAMITQFTEHIKRAPSAGTRH